MQEEAFFVNSEGYYRSEINLNLHDEVAGTPSYLGVLGSYLA
jgi:hypothetical protein